MITDEEVVDDLGRTHVIKWDADKFGPLTESTRRTIAKQFNPEVDISSLPGEVEPPKTAPQPISIPKPPTIDDKIREQPTFGGKLQTALSFGMDPIGTVEGPDAMKKVVNDLGASVPESVSKLGDIAMDVGTFGLTSVLPPETKQAIKKAVVEKGLTLASSPMLQYLPTGLAGKAVAGVFGVQAAQGGGTELGEAWSLHDAGKDWTDPEVIRKATSGVLDLAMAGPMLGHARAGLSDIASHPTVEAGLSRMQDIVGPFATDLGWHPDLAAVSNVVPGRWLKEQGIRHTNKGWFDDEGNQMDGREVQARYDADQAAIRAAREAPGPLPRPEAITPPGTPVAQPAGVPTLAEFMRANPRLSLPELKSKYNALVEAFSGSQPKTVAQAIGDVGELPPELNPEATVQPVKGLPTGDFQTDVLDQPHVERPPVPEGHTRFYRSGEGNFFTSVEERAGSYGEGKGSYVDVPTETAPAFYEEAKRHGQPTPQDVYLPEEYIRKAQPTTLKTDVVGVEGLSDQDRADLFKELGVETPPTEPTGDFAKDVLEKPIVWEESPPVELRPEDRLPVSDLPEGENPPVELREDQKIPLDEVEASTESNLPAVIEHGPEAPPPPPQPSLRQRERAAGFEPIRRGTLSSIPEGAKPELGFDAWLASNGVERREHFRTGKVQYYRDGMRLTKADLAGLRAEHNMQKEDFYLKQSIENAPKNLEDSVSRLDDAHLDKLLTTVDETNAVGRALLEEKARREAKKAEAIDIEAKVVEPTGDFAKDVLEQPTERVVNLKEESGLPVAVGEPHERPLTEHETWSRSPADLTSVNKALEDAGHSPIPPDYYARWLELDPGLTMGDLLDKGILSQDHFAKEVYTAKTEPTGNFEKDVLEQPVSVQEGSGTIAPEPSKVESRTPPGKIVPAPETIVQEASTPPPPAGRPAETTSPKLSLDSILEEKYPGKESYTKAEIKAARSELMQRLRGKGAEKRAATSATEHAKIDETEPGTDVTPPLKEGETPPTKVAKVATSDGTPPKVPLGNPGLISRIVLDTRTNLAKIHPHLGRWFDKFQRDAEGMSAQWIGNRREITKGLKHSQEQAIIRILDSKEGEQMAVAYHLNDRPKMQALLAQDKTLTSLLEELTKSPELVEKAAKLRDLLDQVHARADANKIAIGFRQHYFPHYFAEGGFRPNVKPKATPRTGTMTRRMSKLEKQRLTQRADYIRDPNVLDEYFMEAGRRISEAENFGKRHQKVAKWFEQTEGVDPRVAQYFDKAMQRVTGNEEPAWWRGALGKARRVQALTDLGLAAPLQVGQASHTSAYGGMLRSLEAVKDMRADHAAIGARALKAAALTPDIGIEALGAVRGKWTGGGYMHGIPTMDKGMRVHAFRVGELLHRDAMAGNAGAIRSLKRLGIEDVSKTTPEQIGKKLSDTTQFRTGQLDLPLWQSSPLGRTATMYTSFMYQHTKFMMNMFRHPLKNAPVIARFALVGSLAGEGVNDFRAVVKGRNPEEDKKFKYKEAKWIDVLKNPRIPLTSPLKREVQNLAILGGAGLFQTYIERLADRGQVTLAKLAEGPIATNIEDFAKAALEPKGLKKKARAVGQWGLQQIPGYGYQIQQELLPNKKRLPDPLLNVDY